MQGEPPEPPAPPPPDHNKDFDEAVKKLKAATPDPEKKKLVTAVIRAVYGVDPCIPPQTWNPNTQQCE